MIHLPGLANYGRCRYQDYRTHRHERLPDEQLQAPDSLLSLHIAFLAYASLADDMHTRASAPEEPTLNSIAQKETVLLDRAKQLLRDLWHENGKDFDAELQVDETEDDDGEAEDDTHNKASKVEEAVSRAVKEL